ncbi:MAG: hypothetical protein Q4A86_01035, partial [Clostridia bacterium]|nr:hypothetical protein [Clostridia bacterium]
WIECQTPTLKVVRSNRIGHTKKGSSFRVAFYFSAIYALQGVKRSAFFFYQPFAVANANQKTCSFFDYMLQ